jgi:hypothetical protein
MIFTAVMLFSVSLSIALLAHWALDRRRYWAMYDLLKDDIKFKNARIKKLEEYIEEKAVGLDRP